MSANTSISIIIPAYNVEEYIRECLDSILNQTFTDYEVIVVDDCSTDNTYSIIQSYIPKFNNKLTLLKTDKNSGTCSIPRNMGLSYAKGEYIYFLDADDYIANNALEIINNIITKNDVDMVYFPRLYKIDNNILLKLRDDSVHDPKGINNITKTEQIVSGEDMVKTFIFPGTNTYAMLKIIKRDILTMNNIFNLPIICQDHIWTLEVYLNITNCYICTTPIYYYNINPQSLQHKKINPKKWLSNMLKSILTSYERVEQLQQKFPILQKPFYCECFINRLYYYRKINYRQIIGDSWTEDMIQYVMNTEIKDPALLEIFNRKWQSIVKNEKTLTEIMLTGNVNGGKSNVEN